MLRVCLEVGRPGHLSPALLQPSHASDLNAGDVVATLKGVWRCRVSVRTGGPGVSILWLVGVAATSIIIMMLLYL